MVRHFQAELTHKEDTSKVVVPKILELRHIKYTMALSGLNEASRAKLGKILRSTSGTITVLDAAKACDLSSREAAKLLAYFAAHGWLSRVRRGLYIAIPLDAKSEDISLDDPWVVATRLYAPCYIGGWSAAEHWDLTEQIFNSLLVMTTKSPRDRTPTIKDARLLLRTVPDRFMFGLETIWRERNKVLVSDPTRTIVDMLHDPSLGGGIRPAVDVLKSYMSSKNKDLTRLVAYAAQLRNGAVFKRLGFLLERLAPDEELILKECRQKMTQGNAKLDPDLAADHLVTAWRLWIPKGWRERLPK